MGVVGYISFGSERWESKSSAVAFALNFLAERLPSGPGQERVIESAANEVLTADLSQPTSRDAVTVLANDFPQYLAELQDSERRSNLEALFGGLINAARLQQRHDRLTASCRDADRYLGPTLTGMGFVLDEIQSDILYKGRPAWAVYYRGQDCKLQICSCSREGSTDFMLAALDVPNCFGLEHAGEQWHFLLALSDVDDGLVTPAAGADEQARWDWRTELLRAHLPKAAQSLLDQT